MHPLRRKVALPGWPGLHTRARPAATLRAECSLYSEQVAELHPDEEASDAGSHTNGSLTSSVFVQTAVRVCFACRGLLSA